MPASLPGLLAACIIAAALAAPAAGDEPGRAREPKGYHCDATFLDGQRGEVLGRRDFEFDHLKPGIDPVNFCLAQAAKNPLPNAIAFACECQPK